MDARDQKELETLERWLRDAAPALPELEPDPHLPARVRALARERAAGRTPAPSRRWGLVTAGAAALAVAALVGGYVGYRAGLARAPLATAVTPVETTTDAGEDLAAIDAFWSAWSQGGFADDLSDLTGTSEVAE